MALHDDPSALRRRLRPDLLGRYEEIQRARGISDPFGPNTPETEFLLKQPLSDWLPAAAAQPGAPEPTSPRPPAPDGLIQRWTRKVLQGPLYDLIVPHVPDDEDLDRSEDTAPPAPVPQVPKDEEPDRREDTAPPAPEEDAAFDDDPRPGGDGEDDARGSFPPENRFLPNEPISDRRLSGDSEPRDPEPRDPEPGGADFLPRAGAPKPPESDFPHDSRRGLAKAPLPGDGAADPPVKRAGARPEEQQVAALPLALLFGGGAAGGGLTAAQITALMGSLGLLGLGAKTYLQQQQGSGPHPTPLPSRENPPLPRASGAEAPERRPRPNGPRNEAEQRLWDFVDDVLGNVFPSQADEPGGRPKAKQGEGKDRGALEPPLPAGAPKPQPPGSPLSIFDAAAETYLRRRQEALRRQERKRQIEAGEIEKVAPRHAYGSGGNLKTQAAVDTFNRIFIDVGREFGVDFPASLKHVGGGKDITRDPDAKLKEWYLPSQLRKQGDPPLQGSNRMDSAFRVYGYLYSLHNLQRLGAAANEADQLALAAMNGTEGFVYGILKQLPDEDDPAFARRLTEAARGILQGLKEFHEELVERFGRDPATLDKRELERVILEKKNELWEKYGRHSSPGAPGGILPGQPRRPPR